MNARRLLAVAVTLSLLWLGYCAYLAHSNLVTLSVRNMEVRRVVAKLKWQTWEHFEVNTNVHGLVTLNVRKVPLDEVLNIIALQTDARWTRLYPLYSSKKSAGTFNQVVRGERLPAGSGWSVLQQASAWQQVGSGGFGNALRAQNRLVSAELVNRDLAFTALALSRFSKAQLIPEDGTPGYVNLKVQQVPFEKVVAKIARQVQRKWDEVYAIEPRNVVATMAKPRTVVQQGVTNVIVEPSGAITQIVTNVVVVKQTNPEPPANDTMSPERALEAIMTTMSPEERAQVQEQLAIANQSGAGTPAERQQQLQSAAAQAAQAAQAETESRIEKRLKDGTVDQRLAHDRRVIQKQQQAAQKKQ